MEPNPITSYRRANGIRLEDLGKALGVGRATVCKWEKKRVPAERVLHVERVTGIPRSLLRPDLYPDGLMEAAQ